MAKYVLIGLRPSSDSEDSGSTHRTRNRFLAILKPLRPGRRVVAEITGDDCKSWTAAKAAIIRYTNRDGVKRLDPSDIQDPNDNERDWPWVNNPPSEPNGQSGTVQSGGAESAHLSTPGVDRSSGKYYRYCSNFGRKTNADYLRELQEANFEASPEMQLEANEIEIKLL